MDIFDAASYFDAMVATDAYDGSVLFTCQMDLYDNAERDSSTGWRRSCSAPAITLPARRVIAIDSDVFLVGRRVKDYFEALVIREHAVLHPSDGAYFIGSAKQFIKEDYDIPSFYGAKAYRSEQKESDQSSELFSTYNIYAALTESAVRDQIIRGPDNTYYRVLNKITQTGEYISLVVAELGASALTPVAYVSSSGVSSYDPLTDTSGAEAPSYIDGIIERFQTNYRYMTWAAEKYQNGDMVLTVSATDVDSPQNNDRVVVNSVNYRVVSAQSDGSDCWELHIRPAEFNLSVET